MPTVIPGKLKLKGAGGPEKKKKKKRSRDERDNTIRDSQVSFGTQEGDKSNGSSSSSSSSRNTHIEIDNPDEFLTETQKKFEQKKIKLELEKAKSVIGTTYRDRVEQLNYELSIKSEHNDIPRISAAGNG
jgi:protein FAM32A